MYVKVALLLVALVAGSWAFPKLEDEQDMSIFFTQLDSSARIVGGTQAPSGSHPHMVAMTTGTFIRSFSCGGSVVGRRSVLTAAHCIAAVFSFGSLASTLRLTVGTNFWNQGGTMYTVARNITHPHYVSATIKNDIGLFITHNNIIDTTVVRSIPLNFDYVPGGVLTRVAGWGRIRTGGAISPSLLEIIVPTISGSACVASAIQAGIDLNMRPPPVEPHIELCTFHGPNVGTCNGDSGSALARLDNGQQIGVVSWGFPCARGGPDMFVRVSAYQSWLQQSIV
ncbi:chymotrypsin-2 [Manduca sexta]|uniref:chymotrypsin-2 n=1 Tax=Manduca sexta TaxID=7130 RepID=UPI00188F5965|nr:chymotrypsin-2 [Manduca sexta]